MPHTAKLKAHLNALNKEIAMLLGTAALVSAAAPKKRHGQRTVRRHAKQNRWTESPAPGRR